ncbi:MAG: hypothetical protein ACR2PF_00105 [Rhizobiaceae bacterium]
MAILIILPPRFTLEHFGLPVLPAFILGSLGATAAIAPVFMWFLAKNASADLTVPVSIGLFIVIVGVITLITYSILRLCGVEIIPANMGQRRQLLHDTEKAVATEDDTQRPPVESTIMPKLPAENAARFSR